MQTAPERLRHARERAGFATARAFCRAHGIPEPTYSLHESGKRQIRPHVAARYAKALGNCMPEWILTGLGRGPDDPSAATGPAPSPPPDVAGSGRRGPGAWGTASTPGVALPPRTSMPRDLPVYGTAAGADNGAFELNTGEAIDWLRRPPGLEGLREAFAIYAVDESMSPRFEPGEAAISHPGKPPVPGCDVIVELKEDEEGHRKALLKRFVRRTATKLVLEQFNPKKTIEIPLAKVVAVHRVLRWHEVLGV